MASPYWSYLAKHNYLAYRKLQAAKTTRSRWAFVQAMRDLDSNYSTRGNLPHHLKAAPDIIDLVNFMKSTQSAENRLLAQTRIDKFLKEGAASLKEELELLGNYFVGQNPFGTVKWVPGPIKKLEKAMSKTVENYEYKWGENKDLVRATLVCNTNQALAAVAAMIKRTCVPEHGMELRKEESQSSTRDGGNSKTGYSGWNFAIGFQEHPGFASELQANTPDMMYGKMSKSEFCEILGYSETEYYERQAKLKVPGGLGHALYDIQDNKRSGAAPAEAEEARRIALDYNDALRQGKRKPNLEELNNSIRDLGPKLTSEPAKAVWREGVEGSSWRGMPISTSSPGGTVGVLSGWAFDPTGTSRDPLRRI